MHLETPSPAVPVAKHRPERRYPRHFLSAPVTTSALSNLGPQATRGLS